MSSLKPFNYRRLSSDWTLVKRAAIYVLSFARNSSEFRVCLS